MPVLPQHVESWPQILLFYPAKVLLPLTKRTSSSRWGTAALSAPRHRLRDRLVGPRHMLEHACATNCGQDERNAGQQPPLQSISVRPLPIAQARRGRCATQQRHVTGATNHDRASALTAVSAGVLITNQPSCL